MTYIIAGKLNGSTFMMADCIVTNSQTSDTCFTQKLVKLDSSESTFFSFTGIQFIDICLKYFDAWLFDQNKTNDFTTGDHSIEQFQVAIKMFLKTFPERDTLKLGSNRLFFIDKENVIYYDFVFDEDNNLKNIDKNIISEGFYASSVIYSTEVRIDDNMIIEEYCKNMIKYLSRDSLDFKDRYSFVEIFRSGEFTHKKPFKSFSDYVAMFNGVEYKNIDDPFFFEDLC